MMHIDEANRSGWVHRRFVRRRRAPTRRRIRSRPAATPGRRRSTPAVLRSSSRARRTSCCRASTSAAPNSARIPPASTSSWRNTLLPHFDTPYAAQLVLGQHWRNATPDQRKRFVEAFYQSLLYTYGDAMVDFTGDRLKVFPTKVAPTDERATVRTEIKRSNGTKVPVSYIHAQGQRRVEGVGRRHRRHQLREELPRRLRRRGRRRRDSTPSSRVSKPRRRARRPPRSRRPER